MSTPRRAGRPIPRPTAVAPGVWSLPLPLAGSPIGYANAYALEHDDGVLLVDAGYPDASCWSALVDALALLGRPVADVTGVVLTHNHPDHVGLADRVRGASGAWVAINELDAPSRSPDAGETHLGRLETEFRLAGLPDETVSEFVEASRSYAAEGQRLSVDRFLSDGDLVSEHGLDLRVLWTPGHTRGHLCLHDERAGHLFGGDLLLTTGEIQLGLVVCPDDDPAGDLIASLEWVASLPISLVLPGHGDCFGDSAVRAAASIADVERRLGEVAAHVREHPGLTAWERCSIFPRDRDWERRSGMGRRFAVMQMMGWLRRLGAAGQARIDPGPPERTFPV